MKVRFLHLVQRLDSQSWTAAVQLEFVDRLEVERRVYQPWQEAAERSFICDALDPCIALERNARCIQFPSRQSKEQLRDEQDQLAGEIVRQWQDLAVSLHYLLSPVGRMW